jgi:hypothetical protein
VLLSSDVHRASDRCPDGARREAARSNLGETERGRLSRCARIAIVGWHGQRILQTEQRDETATIVFSREQVGIATDDAWDTILRFQ